MPSGVPGRPRAGRGPGTRSRTPPPGFRPRPRPRRGLRARRCAACPRWPACPRGLRAGSLEPEAGGRPCSCVFPLNAASRTGVNQSIHEGDVRSLPAARSVLGVPDQVQGSPGVAAPGLALGLDRVEPGQELRAGGAAAGVGSGGDHALCRGIPVARPTEEGTPRSAPSRGATTASPDPPPTTHPEANAATPGRRSTSAGCDHPRPQPGRRLRRDGRRRDTRREPSAAYCAVRGARRGRRLVQLGRPRPGDRAPRPTGGRMGIAPAAWRPRRWRGLALRPPARLPRRPRAGWIRLDLIRDEEVVVSIADSFRAVRWRPEARRPCARRASCPADTRGRLRCSSRRRHWRADRQSYLAARCESPRHHLSAIERCVARTPARSCEPAVFMSPARVVQTG